MSGQRKQTGRTAAIAAVLLDYLRIWTTRTEESFSKMADSRSKGAM